MKKEIFKLTKEAQEELISFVEKRDPDLMTKACQMLAALQIVKGLTPKQGFRYILNVVEDMRQSGHTKFSEEKWDDLPLDAYKKYLPKILKERKWIYDIQDYIRDKARNHLKTIVRQAKLKVPLYITNEKGDQIENPEIKALDDFKIALEEIEINDLIERVNLTDIEKHVFNYKVFREYREEYIAKELGVTRDIVKHNYAKAKNKIVAYILKHKLYPR